MWRRGVRRVRELSGMRLMGCKRLHCWDSLEILGRWVRECGCLALGEGRLAVSHKPNQRNSLQNHKVNAAQFRIKFRIDVVLEWGK
jgi:hypothetical protein